MLYIGVIVQIWQMGKLKVKGSCSFPKIKFMSVSTQISFLIPSPVSTAERQMIHVSVCQVTLVLSNSLQPRGLQPTRLLCPWDSLGKNIGVGCHALLQGIFPTQGSNSHLLRLHQAGRFFTTSAIWSIHEMTIIQGKLL